ncbi:MAG: NACHT domain-containing protein [Anaerolineae bacterium]|nr:NACHT domain-containing protein [Anaerolineae bacterium]
MYLLKNSLQAIFNPTSDHPEAEAVINLPPQLQDLLAYVAIEPGKIFRRSQVAAMLWPNAASTSEQLENLRSRINQLRIRLKTAGAHDYFVVTEDSIAFNKHLPYWVDVVTLAQAASLPRTTLQAQMAAAGLYQGVFLENRSFRKASKTTKRDASQTERKLNENDEDLDSWLEREHEAVRQHYERLLTNILDTLCQNERWDDLWPWLSAWQQYLPAADPANLVAFKMQWAGGIKNAAALDEHYFNFKQKYRGGNKKIDRLYERLKTEVMSSKPAIHLPQIKNFVGRDEQLDTLHAYVEGGRGYEPVRVISIWGLGGMGKSSLALKLADEHIRHPKHKFADGAFLINAENIRQFSTWLANFAEIIGFKFYDHSTPKTQLLNYLRRKAILFIFDGLETLLTHDREAILDFVTDLFHTAPRITQLITSRERLGLSIEQSLALEGLAYADAANDIRQTNSAKPSAAYQLFCDTAKAIQHRFRPEPHRADILYICHLTEGMPLALKLAATHTQLLTPKEIAARIAQNLSVLQSNYRDLPDRHRSIQAVFESSWQLLLPDAQRTLAQLSVFRDDFSAASAEQVARTDLAQLQMLLDKSLLQSREWSLPAPHDELDGQLMVKRLSLHALVKRFAADKLQHHPEWRDVYDKKTAYFAQFAKNNVQQQKALDLEWVNLLDAMGEAAEQGQHAVVVGFAEALGEAWYVRGRYADARTGLRWACDAARKLKDDRALVKFLAQWGRACVRQGDYAEAKVHFVLGNEIGTRDMDPLSIAQIAYESAQVAIEETDFVEAQTCLDLCLDIYEELNHDEGRGEALRQQARIFFNQGQYLQAEKFAHAAHKLLQQVDNPRTRVMILRLRSDIASEIGATIETEPAAKLKRVEEAQAYQDEGMRLCAEIGDLREEGLLLYSQARSTRIFNDWEKTIHILQKHAAIANQLGDLKMQAYADGFLGYAFFETQQFERAEYHLAKSVEILRSLNDMLSAINPLYRLGRIYDQKSQPAEAVAALGEAYLYAKRFNTPRKRDIYDALLRLGETPLW